MVVDRVAAQDADRVHPAAAARAGNRPPPPPPPATVPHRRDFRKAESQLGECGQDGHETSGTPTARARAQSREPRGRATVLPCKNLTSRAGTKSTHLGGPRGPGRAAEADPG